MLRIPIDQIFGGDSAFDTESYRDRVLSVIIHLRRIQLCQPSFLPFLAFQRPFVSDGRTFASPIIVQLGYHGSDFFDFSNFTKSAKSRNRNVFCNCKPFRPTIAPAWVATPRSEKVGNLVPR